MWFGCLNFFPASLPKPIFHILPLTLFVTRILADHHDNAFSSNNSTRYAPFLNRCSDFHDNPLMVNKIINNFHKKSSLMFITAYPFLTYLYNVRNSILFPGSPVSAVVSKGIRRILQRNTGVICIARRSDHGISHKASTPAILDHQVKS